MPVVHTIQKRGQLVKADVVRFQLLTFCFFQGLSLTENELACLVQLALKGAVELNGFCKDVHEQQLYASPQTVRNLLTKFERLKLVVKEGRSRKKVCVHPDVGVHTEGNILLDFRFACLS
jgi:hypothetical protein